MDTCEKMTEPFYNTVTSLFAYYLPLMTVTRHTTHKLWVTDRLRHLIRCRQHALTTGLLARYPADVADTAAQVLRQEAGETA